MTTLCAFEDFTATAVLERNKDMGHCPNGSAATILLAGPEPESNSLHSSLTDYELYKKCQEYGLSARAWMRKFAGLLPEVMRRHLYKKKGYISIYEFAAKLAGMSVSSVDKILDIAEKLQDKPKLRSLLEAGSIGWSKLQTVAYIATPETDRKWAEKAEKLGARTLEAYVQETRRQEGTNRLHFPHVGKAENIQQTLQEVFRHLDSRDLEVQEKWNTLSFPVHPSIEKRLRLLKRELEKEKKQALGWNEVLMELIKSREHVKQAEKKVVIVPVCEKCTREDMNFKEEIAVATRSIPAAVKNIIQQRSGGTCEFLDCKKAGEIYHHTRRYALRKNHDPRYIVWLCKAHEGIAQAGLIENEEDPPSMWHIREEPDRTDLKFLIDEKVAGFRKEPELVPKQNSVNS